MARTGRFPARPMRRSTPVRAKPGCSCSHFFDDAEAAAMTHRCAIPTLLLSVLAALPTSSPAAPNQPAPLLNVLRDRGAHVEYGRKLPGKPAIGVTLTGPSTDD